MYEVVLRPGSCTLVLSWDATVAPKADQSVSTRSLPTIPNRTDGFRRETVKALGLRKCVIEYEIESNQKVKIMAT